MPLLYGESQKEKQTKSSPTFAKSMSSVYVTIHLLRVPLHAYSVPPMTHEPLTLVLTNHLNPP